MKCDQTRAAIEANGYRADRFSATSRTHLASCELCRVWFQEELLRVALAHDQVPEPSGGFIERVLMKDRSGEAKRSWGTSWAAAAGIVVALTGLLFVALGLQGTLSGDLAQSGRSELRMVNVVITAQGYREDATLTIRLAEDLELDGYADLHLIQWQTDLQPGRNLLALPVRSKTGTGGDIWIALAYEGAREQEMRIRVDAG